MERQAPRYNLVVGPYEFVQDISNLKRYHIPGGTVVDETWIKRWAYAQQLDVQRVYAQIDGRANNEVRRMGRWEAQTRERFEGKFNVADRTDNAG